MSDLEPNPYPKENPLELEKSRRFLLQGAKAQSTDNAGMGFELFIEKTLTTLYFFLTLLYYVYVSQNSIIYFTNY